MTSNDANRDDCSDTGRALCGRARQVHLGFGESLVAIPLLTLVLGIQTAAPLVSLMAGSIDGRRS